ncbi:hypothetical protein [Micromonospora maris]|uniref:hypothetical protein n=1 Tax=Micromonospora maris TaxID=1003110 RepID=UPI002E12A886|nr:hypothetical protein OG712_16490 [Micromonospora maris]
MECATGDAVYIGTIGQVVGFFERGIDGILSDIAAAIMGAAVELFANLGDIPTLGDQQLNESIHMQTDWLVVTIAVASLLAAAFRVALERKGQPLTVALLGLVRMVLTVGAAWTVANWLASEADAYSHHLYEEGIKAQLKLIANCGTDGLTAFLLIIVGLLLLIAGCVHVILMYIRLGVMVLLTGTLPLAAAASMSEWGGGWWRKHIAWMVAWLAFKPVVGLIMYSGAAMIGATGDNAKHYKLAGAAVLLMAAVALPALMRLVVPAMATLGSRDSSGTGMAAAGAAAGAVATGAKKIAGAGGQAASAISGKPRPPSGNSAPTGSGSRGSSAGGASGGGASGGGSSGGGASGAGGGGGGASGGSGDGDSGGSGSRLAAAGTAARRVAGGAIGVAAWTVGQGASAVQKTASGARSTHKHASDIASGALGDRD